MAKKVKGKIPDEYKHSICCPKNTKEECFRVILSGVLRDHGKEIATLTTGWEEHREKWFYSVYLKTRRKRGTKI